MESLGEQSWPQETAGQWRRLVFLHPRAWLGNPHSACCPPCCNSASCIRIWEGRFHSVLSVWRNLLLPCAILPGPGLALCAEGLPSYKEDWDTHKIQILISFINHADSFHPTLSGNSSVSNMEQLVCPNLGGRDNVIDVSADEKTCLLLYSQKHAALMREVVIRAPATGTLQVAAIVL